MRKQRVLIIDDHPLFREGLKSLINRSSKYVVVGEAGNGEKAIQLAPELKPDLITMDISLPGKSGIETTCEIRKLLPEVQILIVSMHPKIEFIAAAFKAGAKGYVIKEATSTKLIAAMDTLSQGEYFLDGSVSIEIIHKMMSDSEEDSTVEDKRYGLLSPREQQVMRMVVEGGSSREIASQLTLSLKTVENHRANLMKKLEVHNKMELVRYAARLGLIDLEQWKE